MTDLFIHFDGNTLSTSSDPHPDCFCVDLDSFIDSCLAGHNCAMRVCIYQDESIDYRLALNDSMAGGDISSNDFYARLNLLIRIYDVLEGCQDV